MSTTRLLTASTIPMPPRRTAFRRLVCYSLATHCLWLSPGVSAAARAWKVEDPLSVPSSSSSFLGDFPFFLSPLLILSLSSCFLNRYLDLIWILIRNCSGPQIILYATDRSVSLIPGCLSYLIASHVAEFFNLEIWIVLSKVRADRGHVDIIKIASHWHDLYFWDYFFVQMMFLNLLNFVIEVHIQKNFTKNFLIVKQCYNSILVIKWLIQVSVSAFIFSPSKLNIIS